MYLLMGYLAGKWGIVDIDEHEDCAARFIEQFDEFFGEGAAYVVKLPDRDEEASILQARKLLAKWEGNTEDESNADNFGEMLQKFTSDDEGFSRAMAELIRSHNEQ